MELKNSTLSDFLIKNKTKDIVCFGAGKLFQDLFITMEDEFLKQIRYVVDSNKKDDIITINNHKIELVNFRNVKKIDIRNSVFLITTMYCYDLFEMLNRKFCNEEIDCYVYTIMSMTVENGKVLKCENQNKMVIPKIIHYCWFGGQEMPDKNKRCIDSWQKICPDYEIKCWDEKNYDVSKNQYMYDAFLRGKWGFVPDYARLDIIYNYGGIYLDTDVELVKRPDKLLKYDGFMGFQRNYWIALGLGFGAKKGNELIRGLRDDYNAISFINKDGDLNLTAAPYYQTLYLKKRKIKCNNEIQYIDNNIIVPTDWFDPQSYDGGTIKTTKNTISVHHYDESWVDNKHKNIEKYREIEKLLKYFKSHREGCNA